MFISMAAYFINLLCFVFEIYVAQAALKLLFLLLCLQSAGVYRCSPPHLYCKLICK